VLGRGRLVLDTWAQLAMAEEMFAMNSSTEEVVVVISDKDLNK
jgi:hypothetical protein